MKRLIIIQLCIFLFISTSFAQQKASGVSLPGRIGQKKEKIIPRLKASDIKCTVSSHDSSGDNILSKGEEEIITVLVKNNSSSAVLEPKLEISMLPSWSSISTTTTEMMDSIAPGQSRTYKCSFKWNEKLPTGTVLYKARVSDIKSGLSSEPVEISFNVLGKENISPPSDFIDVDKSIPNVPIQKSNAIAVIIGNRDYSNSNVPNVDYAINDATGMKKYLSRMCGFPEENIIFIENANKGDFERIFGTREVHEGKLYNLIKPDQSDIFIYYSGHGAPDDPLNKKGYLMPSDFDPNYIKIDGYPLDVFCKNIEELPAKSTTIVLDACFSGGCQNGSILPHGSKRHIKIEVPKLFQQITLFMSASGDQISSWYPEANHSLFTYYFLRAFRGEADEDNDRQITLKEMKDYLDQHVSEMAKRLYEREQTPIVKGEMNTVICTY